jgi:hypothetical protein
LPGIATATGWEFGGHRCAIADCVLATRNSASQKAQDFANARTDFFRLLLNRTLTFSRLPRNHQPTRCDRHLVCFFAKTVSAGSLNCVS